MNPMNSVRITSLTHNAESFNGANIVIFDKLTLVIELFDDSNGGWSHVQTLNLILFTASPHDASVGYHWLAFKEHRGGTSEKRTIHNETMADNPAHITASKVNCPLMYIKHMFHAPVQANCSTATVANSTLWLSSSSRRIQNIEWVCGQKLLTFGNFLLIFHQFVHVKIHLIIKSLLKKFSFELLALFDKSWQILCVFKLCAVRKCLINDGSVFNMLTRFNTTGCSNK
mmetsp:Transcript_101300/g.139940  ORF Transcript_101300/g.139940 Transcript_101300/m.139940 type:complete len:228 (-) Transcript_101300:558-1241(-)